MDVDETYVSPPVLKPLPRRLVLESIVAASKKRLLVVDHLLLALLPAFTVHWCKSSCIQVRGSTHETVGDRSVRPQNEFQESLPGAPAREDSGGPVRR